jgi:hypothetical protein
VEIITEFCRNSKTAKDGTVGIQRANWPFADANAGYNRNVRFFLFKKKIMAGKIYKYRFFFAVNAFDRSTSNGNNDVQEIGLETSKSIGISGELASSRSFGEIESVLNGEKKCDERAN